MDIGRAKVLRARSVFHLFSVGRLVAAPQRRPYRHQYTGCTPALKAIQLLAARRPNAGPSGRSTEDQRRADIEKGGPRPPPRVRLRPVSSRGRTRALQPSLGLHRRRATAIDDGPALIRLAMV